MSFAISRTLLKLMSIESMMSYNHLIFCHALLLLPLIFPGIRVFSTESALLSRWPKYCSFSSASVLSMNIQGRFPLGLTDLISLQSKELSRVFSNTTARKHQFLSTQPFLWSHSHPYKTTGIAIALTTGGASLVAQLVKNLPEMRETWVRSLGWEDPQRRERLPTPVFWPRKFHGLHSP